MARFLQMELLILREKGRESVFGAVRVALLFVLIVSSLAHAFGDQDFSFSFFCFDFIAL